MTEPNKKRLVSFGKGLFLVLVGFIALITSNGVWNGVAAKAIDPFYGWVAGLNLITVAFGIWTLYKKFFPKVKKDETSRPNVPVTNQPNAIPVEEQEEEYYY